MALVALRTRAVLCGLVLGTLSSASLGAAPAEYVLVQKVIDDQAVIVRSNGATFIIEKGIGCLSLWRYEGKRVIVDSPGIFLGVGSKLVIPDADQECRIWNSREIDPPRPSSAPSRSGPQSLQEDEFSFFDSTGRAAAYLEADGLTFYLWSGQPVAYLVEDSVFGFNGKDLGWYHKGMVYDHDGGVVVAPPAAFRDRVAPAPTRALKQLKPLKGLKELNLSSRCSALHGPRSLRVCSFSWESIDAALAKNQWESLDRSRHGATDFFRSSSGLTLRCAISFRSHARRSLAAGSESRRRSDTRSWSRYSDYRHELI